MRLNHLMSKCTHKKDNPLLLLLHAVYHFLHSYRFVSKMQNSKLLVGVVQEEVEDNVILEEHPGLLDVL